MRRSGYLALATLAAVGCGGVSEKNVHGYYVPGTDASAKPPSDEIAKAFYAFQVLEIRPDHRYSYSGFEGSWRLKGDKLILTPERMFGRTKTGKEKHPENFDPMSLTVKDGGDRLVMSYVKYGLELTFTKRE